MVRETLREWIEVVKFVEKHVLCETFEVLACFLYQRGENGSSGAFCHKNMFKRMALLSGNVIIVNDETGCRHQKTISELHVSNKSIDLSRKLSRSLSIQTSLDSLAASPRK